MNKDVKRELAAAKTISAAPPEEVGSAPLNEYSAEESKANAAALLGRFTRGGERKSAVSPMFLALQKLPHVYAGTVPVEEIVLRRKRNRHARRARAGNTAALRREARSNKVAGQIARFRRGHAPDPLGLHTESETI